MTVIEHWRIPTTWAEYKEGQAPPWCIIHHTCVSGSAWVKFKDDPKSHLCAVEMVITPSKDHKVIGSLLTVGIAYSHIDRSKPVKHSMCGVDTSGEVEDISIGRDRHLCCLACWDKKF